MYLLIDNHNYIIILIQMGLCDSHQSRSQPGQQNKERVEGQGPSWLKQFEISKPELMCPSSNEITRMCISRHCRNISLFCEEADCQACHRVHPDCGNVKLETITDLVQKRAELQRQLVLKIEEIEVKTFQSIQNRRAAIVEHFFMGGFHEKYQDLVEGIFLGTKTIHLNGEIAEEFYWRLKDSNDKLARAESETIKYFKREMERISVPLINLEQEVLNYYSQYSQVMPHKHEREFHISQIKQRDTNFGSSIIPREALQTIRFIRESLDNPRQLKLLFTGSDHAFEAKKFHEVCDNLPHTLVLVETEFGKVIGGYTPLAWNATRGYAHDQEGASFLLSVTNLEKMKLVKNEKAIQCIQDHGPVFGSGADLAITDQCHTNGDSCVNFPFSYNNHNKYRFNQEAWTMICGNPEGKKFRVKEYEVFEVVW